MPRASSVSVLFLYAIISGAKPQTKEFDCPEFVKNVCTENPTYENQNVFECKSDYVCGIGQKCCGNCKYGFKICTDVVEKEYLTNQDEYLKNKYCPKVNPCFTPLKNNPKYRCWSDEVCPYGYKCCKSGCYIHKVCVVPIDQEGVEAVPPPTTTTSTTTEVETISSIVTTSTKLPKTTLFLPTPRPGESSGFGSGYTDDDEESDTAGSGATKPSITTSSHQTIIFSAPVTTLAQETSTKIQATTQRSVEFSADDDENKITQTPRPITTSSLQTSTTIAPETFTKISVTTKESTDSVSSDDGFTDGDEDGSDIDYTGSGGHEVVETQPITRTTALYTKITTVSEREKETDVTTITRETTVSAATSTKTTGGSTELVGSGDGFTDDDEDGDDGDDTGSGNYEKTATQPITSTSTFTTKLTTILEKEQTDNVTIAKSSPLTSTRATTSASTIRQETSTKSPGTTQRSTESVSSGDNEDDGDDTGSNNYEKITSTSPFKTKLTTIWEEEPSGSLTSTKASTITITRGTTISATTRQDTKDPETTQKSTEFVGSGDGFTDDDEDGDDGDNTGSKETTTSAIVTNITTPSTGFTTVKEQTTKMLVATSGLTVFTENGTVQTETTSKSTISGQITTLRPTGFTTSGDGSVTDGKSSGDDDKVKTHRPTVTTDLEIVENTTVFSRPQDISSTYTLIQLTSKSTKIHSSTIASDIEGSGSENKLTDDEDLIRKTSQATVLSTDLQETLNFTTGFGESLNSTTTGNFQTSGDSDVAHTLPSSINQNASAPEGMFSQVTVSQGPSSMVTIVSDFDFDSEGNATTTTHHKENTSTVFRTSTTTTTTKQPSENKNVANSTIDYTTLQPSSVTAKSTSSATNNPNLLTTPTRVEFDYEDEPNTTVVSITKEKSTTFSKHEQFSSSFSSTITPSDVTNSSATSIFISTIQSWVSSINTSTLGSGIGSTASPIGETTNRTQVGIEPITPNKEGWESGADLPEQTNQTFSGTPDDFIYKENSTTTKDLSEPNGIPYIVEGVSDFGNKNDLTNNGTSSSTDGKEQKELGTIEAEKTLDNTDFSSTQQTNLSVSVPISAINAIGKSHLLREGSGDDRDDISEDEDNDDDDDNENGNGDDVDEDIRSNFNINVDMS